MLKVGGDWRLRDSLQTAFPSGFRTKFAPVVRASHRRV